MHINIKHETSVSIRISPVEEVEEFVYLGSRISQSGGIDENFTQRTREARQVFTTLPPQN